MLHEKEPLQKVDEHLKFKNDKKILNGDVILKSSGSLKRSLYYLKGEDGHS